MPKKAPAKQKAPVSSKKKATPKKAAPKSTGKTASPKAIAEKQTQSEAIAHLAERTGLEKKQVKELLAATHELIECHLKPKGSGEFTIPELGIKVKRHEKPATKARMGRNPFTGEEIKIKAKPKKKVVKVQPMKKLKELIA